MSDYPARSRPASSEAGVAKCREGAAREAVKIQCGRNGMPLVTDPIGKNAEPGKKPLDSEAQNEAAKI